MSIARLLLSWLTDFFFMYNNYEINEELEHIVKDDHVFINLKINNYTSVNLSLRINILSVLVILCLKCHLTSDILAKRKNLGQLFTDCKLLSVAVIFVLNKHFNDCLVVVRNS